MEVDAGVRGEAIVSSRKDDFSSNVVKYILGIDYQFTPELYALVEYYFNGGGKVDPLSYDLIRLSKGEILNLGREEELEFFVNELVPCFLKCLHGRHEAFLHQENVIGVVGADSEDGNAGLGKRLHHGNHGSYVLHILLPFDLDAPPSIFLLHVVWRHELGANNRKLLLRARDETQLSFRENGRDFCKLRELVDSKFFGEDVKREYAFHGSEGLKIRTRPMRKVYGGKNVILIIDACKGRKAFHSIRRDKVALESNHASNHLSLVL